MVRRTRRPGFLFAITEKSGLFTTLRVFSRKLHSLVDIKRGPKLLYPDPLCVSFFKKKAFAYHPPAAWLRLWSHVAVTSGVIVIELPEASMSPVLVLYWETPCWLVTLPVLTTC